MRYGLHWFRRDLRISGNSSLAWNWKANEGRVLGLFCFDKKFLARPDFSATRFQFFLQTLKALRDELRSHGGDLLCLDTGPDESFPFLFDELKKRGHALPSVITYNRDYEPFARARDARMELFFATNGIALHTERDHIVLEPPEIFKGKDPGDGYVVYTPFSKRWRELFETPVVRARVKPAKAIEGAAVFKSTWHERFGNDLPAIDVLEKYESTNSRRVTIALPPAGSAAALGALRTFKPRLKKYDTARDIPSLEGTSRLSIYLKNGSITTGQIIGELKLGAGSKFLSELIWREFYYHILYRFPHVETEAFQAKYRNIQWQNREDWFEAWKMGQTGFPIVDAGMRQLNSTGWMHNRVRMIVASFLTKDLLIDWRWGEKYFMEKLIDGDLAPNNGGWQWAASTGCDAQPYFRVFNPKLQSERFDPEGEYIRRYVPELAHLPPKEIHEPSPLDRRGYPAPLVDHATQRKLAIALYSA